VFILAAALIIAGVALFVAAPLGIGLVGARAKSASELQAERHEHERALAVQGLRELEFDREMGKLSDADYESMHKALEGRALTAMAAVENIRAQSDKAASAKKATVTPLAPAPAPRRSAPLPRTTEMATMVLHIEQPRTPPSVSPSLQPQPLPSPMQPSPPMQSSSKMRFCPQCGTRAAVDSKFCAQCGIAIKPIRGAIARTE
jgi:cytochrome c-type biogenesis protein CcmI